MGQQPGSAWWQRGVRWLLPPRRNRLVSYTAFEVVLSAFLMTLFWPAFALLVVRATGLGEVIYGQAVVRAAFATGDDRDPVAAARLQLLATLLALPLQVLTPFGVTRLLSRAPAYQYGLTTHRLGRNVLLGVLGWAVLTPVVLTVNESVTSLLTYFSEDAVSPHPFDKLVRGGEMTGPEVALIVILAVVAAPIVEELLFRGVLLQWLCRSRVGSHVVLALAYLIVLAEVVPEHLLRGEAGALSRVGFAALLLGGYIWCLQKPTPVPGAIFASSALFAASHYFAWPSPVPLFVLALGLGWLARRTGSLAGPMVLHALFNGVACVELVLGV